MLKKMSGASEPRGMVTEDAAFTLSSFSPRMEEKEGGANNVLEEIMVENVPNLVKKNEQKFWGDTSQNNIKLVKAAAEHAAEACPFSS